MLRLRTLGGLSLSQSHDSATGIALSRLRLALLARVAAGGEQGVLSLIHISEPTRPY